MPARTCPAAQGLGCCLWDEAQSLWWRLTHQLWKGWPGPVPMRAAGISEATMSLPGALSFLLSRYMAPFSAGDEHQALTPYRIPFVHILMAARGSGWHRNPSDVRSNAFQRAELSMDTSMYRSSVSLSTGASTGDSLNIPCVKAVMCQPRARSRPLYLWAGISRAPPPLKLFPWRNTWRTADFMYATLLSASKSTFQTLGNKSST